MKSANLTNGATAFANCLMRRIFHSSLTKSRSTRTPGSCSITTFRKLQRCSGVIIMRGLNKDETLKMNK